MDRKFILTGLGYAIVGLALGIHMALTKNHGQHVTHAHIMLVGFVVTFIYGLCHRLWLNDSTKRLATVQYYLHQVGVLVLLAGLFLMYGNYVQVETVGPILGVASVLVLVGMVLMKVLFIQTTRQAQPGRARCGAMPDA